MVSKETMKEAFLFVLQHEDLIDELEEDGVQLGIVDKNFNLGKEVKGKCASIYNMKYNMDRYVNKEVVLHLGDPLRTKATYLGEFIITEDDSKNFSYETDTNISSLRNVSKNDCFLYSLKIHVFKQKNGAWLYVWERVEIIRKTFLGI